MNAGALGPGVANTVANSMNLGSNAVVLLALNPWAAGGYTYIAQATIVAAGSCAMVLTAGQVTSGTVIFLETGSCTAQLPTAAAIVAVLSTEQQQTGRTFDLFWAQSDFSGSSSITPLTNTGLTLYGAQAIRSSNCMKLSFTITNVGTPAVNVFIIS